LVFLQPGMKSQEAGGIGPAGAADLEKARFSDLHHDETCHSQ
jgi:hypothetical protein